MSCGYDGAVERDGVLELDPATMLAHVRFAGTLAELIDVLESRGWRREGAVYVKAVNRRVRANQLRLAGF